MKVNVYFSGTSPTGAPWSQAARADHEGHNELAAHSVKSLSRGAPVYMITVDVPDDVLTVPPVVQGGDAVAVAA